MVLTFSKKIIYMRAEKLIAANWKMNGSFALIEVMQKVLSPLLEETTCEIVICPPDVLLYSMTVSYTHLRAHET